MFYDILTVRRKEQAVLIFERKIFRRIYGPKYENGEMEKSDEWRTRTDEILVGCAEVCFLTHFMVQSPS